MNDEMIDVRVDVDPVSEKSELIRFSWGDSKRGWAEGCFLVQRNALREAADETRSALAALVADGLEKAFANQAQCLADLAKAGARLRFAMFDKSTEGNGGAGDPDKTWERLRSLRAEGPVQLNFNVPSNLHFPWGLAFDPPDPQSPPSGSLGQFENFWALKYLHSSTYVGIEDDWLESMGTLEVVLMESPAVMQRIQDYLQALKASLPDPAKIDAIYKVREQLTNYLQVITNPGDLFQKWSQIRDTVVVTYFYCHADGEQLSFGALKNEQIKLSAFKFELSRKRKGKIIPCLLFMNGCSTAIGGSDNGFLESAGSSGYCGLIGTETKIPDVFALRFGMAFLYEFLRGAPVVEVMDKLRRKHWPLGLVYSTYCYPSVSLAAPKPLPELNESNYCQDYLGTKVMI